MLSLFIDQLLVKVIAMIYKKKGIFNLGDD